MATLILRDMLGSDVRSRANARKIYAELESSQISQIDLSGVEFVSRSVADEFCNIMDKHEVVFINASVMVGNMMDIVKKGRGVERERSVDANIIECKSMKDLEAIFATM